MKLSEVQKFINGKNVCLLGNAKTILDKNNNIDSYNIICRINRAFPKDFFDDEKIRNRYAPHIGTRTDILFIGSEHDVFTCKPKIIMYYPSLLLRLKEEKIVTNAYDVLIEDCFELKSKLGLTVNSNNEPLAGSTGLMAIYWLVKYINFKKLTLFGFNFFETESWYGRYNPAPRIAHVPEKEKEYVLKIMKKNKKVILL